MVIQIKKNVEKDGPAPSGSSKFVEYSITFYDGQAPPSFEHTMDALMDAIELHYEKAKDYDGDENEFGLKGEIIGITRKVRKLKRVLWDGKDPLFEGAQEITMDLIGSCLLTLRMQKQVSDKYRAKWRINPNKPDFPLFGVTYHTSTHTPPEAMQDDEDEDEDDVF